MVSIIVPVYNVADYLPKCIESIIGQTMSEWELILVDDGSTDGSGEVCDTFAHCDWRIHVVHTPNRGASSARNTGIDATHGEWITFVDGDDYIDPDYLEGLYRAAIDTGCDVAIGGWENNDVPKVPEYEVIDDAHSIRYFNLKIKYSFVCAKLYRASVIRRHGLRFDPGVAWSEDLLFVYRLVCSHCRRLTMVPTASYHYVYRPGSAAKVKYPFEMEFRGYQCAMALMGDMVDKYSLAIVETFSPFVFLWRAVTAMYRTGIKRRERLAVLRSLDFDPRWMRPEPTHWKEALLARLLVTKQWLLLDTLLTYYYK